VSEAFHRLLSCMVAGGLRLDMVGRCSAVIAVAEVLVDAVAVVPEADCLRLGCSTLPRPCLNSDLFAGVMFKWCELVFQSKYPNTRGAEGRNRVIANKPRHRSR
jgi:hypothetical protein